MEIKNARAYIEEMIELCNQLEDELLTDTCTGIYNDTQVAKTTETILGLARELMMLSSESPWSYYGMDDLRDEVERVYNKMLDEYEES